MHHKNQKGNNQKCPKTDSQKYCFFCWFEFETIYFLLKMKTKQIKWSLLLIDTISHHKVTFFFFRTVELSSYHISWGGQLEQGSLADKL